MRRRTIRAAAVAALTLMSIGLAALQPGCKKKEDRATSSGDIVIGEYASLTGSESAFGTSSSAGLKLAVKEVNDAGGIGGRKIRVVTENTDSKTDQTTAAVKKLISQDQAVAIIGEVASTRSKAGGSVCQGNKIPMVSPASTNPDVTRIGDYIFRVCFTDDVQGPAAADFALRKGWKKVAIITDASTDYSKGLSKTFRQRFADKGGTLVADESYPKDEKDFKSLLNKIKGQNPDAVFASGYYGQVTLLIPQARQLGLNVPFFGGDGWDSPEILKLAGAADGCYFTNHYAPDNPNDTDGRVKRFVDAYKAANNGETPDAMAVLGYDAGKVLIKAIEVSVQKTGKADPAAIRDALAATKGHPGVSGDITIDAERNAKKPIVIVELRGNTTKFADAVPVE